MREIDVGPTTAFADPGRKLIESDGVEIGIFKLNGEFFAYENVCPHMGGPACQGKIIAKVEEAIADDRTCKGMEFSKIKINVVCPWHGFEFDIRTGRHPGNPRYHLRPVKVRLDGADVIVTLPDVKKTQHATPTAGEGGTKPTF